MKRTKLGLFAFVPDVFLPRRARRTRSFSFVLFYRQDNFVGRTIFAYVLFFDKMIFQFSVFQLFL